MSVIENRGGSDLQTRSSEGDLPDVKVRPRSLLIAAGLPLLAYLTLVPSILRTSNPPTGDQPYYLMDAISLARDGDLDVANNYAGNDEDAFYSRAPRPQGFTGQEAPYPLPPHLIVSPARPSSGDFHAPVMDPARPRLDRRRLV
jgi:hypothetical protein